MLSVTYIFISMKKKCIECTLEFSGRSDKKFCSDSCRNEYNNKINRDENNLMRNINNILRKNRRILKYFIPDETTKVHRESNLLSKGFNMNYHTSHITTKTGKIYYFCYEYGYVKLNDGKVAIVKKKILPF